MIVAGYDIYIARKTFNPNTEARAMSTEELLMRAHQAARKAAEAFVHTRSH
ncbi:Uncharacterised protein [Mycobacteroides abscessus subsp. abscessus]|uniref:hypothetical protein n=1 Tax=Mycobacteroides abscessus TaxID=36809 RepID=UPI000926B106|nr:hypothetical protein [Mycobacteroides abscessus]SHS18699.1 Uncharacterised protein [Mycobacteroides abscessus subsp. abscessus]SKO00953.1 Uncharacterised protein [Mycobacteroides abscessus subsp. massiliense]SKO08981.1 Uncharacterised protein [Mycobacteroides abscessus subsp. massiliense]